MTGLLRRRARPATYPVFSEMTLRRRWLDEELGSLRAEAGISDESYRAARHAVNDVFDNGWRYALHSGDQGLASEFVDGLEQLVERRGERLADAKRKLAAARKALQPAKPVKSTRHGAAKRKGGARA